MAPQGNTAMAPGTVPARWWHPLDDGRVQCDLCPRACQLREGQRGFCFVRQHQRGQLVLTSYGRASGFCVDPIEKKPLNHFYPGSSVLSFGTAGCNLGCKFCQNWDLSKATDADRLTEAATPESIAEAAVRSGSTSVAFTYNEPIVFAEYAIDAARACRARGVKTVAVTAGYISPGAREAFFADIDAANIDLKAFTEDFYLELCGGHLQPVLDTLEYVARQTETWLEVTTLIIPGRNDSDDEIGRMAGWIADHLGPEVPLHLTAFHPDFHLVDLGRTPTSTLLRARHCAAAAGLEHVYTGNVRDPIGQSTHCAGCGNLLIERDGYLVGACHLTDGNCMFCGKPLAGRFGTAPGRWEGRRQRIRI